MTMLCQGATSGYTGSMTETDDGGAAMSHVGSTVETAEGSGTITSFESGVVWVRLYGDSFSLPYKAAFTGVLVRVGVASIRAIREACA